MEKVYREIPGFILAAVFGLGIGLIILAFSDSNFMTSLVGVGVCIILVVIFWLLVKLGHSWVNRITNQSEPKK